MSLTFKNNNSIPLLITGLLFILCMPDLFAQNGGFAGASTRIGYSARGMAMANTMTAVTSQGAFSYYNPAQSAFYQNNRQTDLTVGALSFDRVFQSSGIQFQLPPSAGLSFTIMRTGVNDIDARTSSGYPLETFDASEYQFTGNFGIRFTEKFYGGIGLKFSIANYHPQLQNPTSFGIDIGVLYQSDMNLNLAVTLKDLFAGYTWNSQELYDLSQARDVINSFPTRITSGLAYERENFTVSGEAEIQIYNSETPVDEIYIQRGSPVYTLRFQEVKTSSIQLRFGGSWLAHERITLRGGWQLPEPSQIESWSLSSGFSIHLPFDVFSPSIDYAFVMEPYRISNMHIFSLRLNL